MQALKNQVYSASLYDKATLYINVLKWYFILNEMFCFLMSICWSFFDFKIKVISQR